MCDFIVGANDSHSSPAIRQIVHEPAAHYGSGACRLKRKKPYAGMAVRTCHVGSTVGFRKVRNPGKRWEKYRTEIPQDKWGDSHPCRSIEGFDFERPWNQPSKRIDWIAPVQKGQIAPTLPHDGEAQFR